MRLVGNWSYPTSVRFGAGRIAELGAAAKAAGLARPLLVTDPRLATLPPVQRALEALATDGVTTAVFSGIKPNPIAANVAAGLSVLQAEQHDGVIALGGGSPAPWQGSAPCRVSILLVAKDAAGRRNELVARASERRVEIVELFDKAALGRLSGRQELGFVAVLEPRIAHEISDSARWLAGLSEDG